MKNTVMNRQALNEMRSACEGTRWEFNFREKENRLAFYLRPRQDAPEYTPEVYCLDEWLEAGEAIRLGVQTTSYGSLGCSEIKKVADGLMEAARLVMTLAAAATAHGIETMPA